MNCTDLLLMVKNTVKWRVKMDHECHNKNIKPIYLRVIVVEPILLSCLKGVSLDELFLQVQLIMPLPFTILKIYLYYLIDLDFISYDGKMKIYLINGHGLNLLNTIYKQKKTQKFNIENLAVKIE